jgi:hypothetical protein
MACEAGSHGRDFRGRGGGEVGVVDVAGVGAASESAGEAGSGESNAAGEVFGAWWVRWRALIAAGDEGARR